MKPGKLYILPLLLIGIQSCSKTTDEPFIPCSEKVIEISAVLSPAAGCGTNSGSIIASASGSAGFTYRINGAAFQSAGSFTNLPNGSYTVTARDAQGCEQTKLVLVASGVEAGPKFTALKNLFVLKCNRCHGGTSPAALKDWSVDCVILENKALINNRAVVIGDMPKGGAPLNSTEKGIITDWIAAGGLIEN